MLGLAAAEVSGRRDLVTTCQSAHKTHKATCYTWIDHDPDGPGYERLADGSYKAWRRVPESTRPDNQLRR